MNIPITIEALASFAGGLFLAAVAGLWLKGFLKDWRFTPIMVLAVTVILVEGANWLAYGAEFTARQAGLAAFWALFAATLETWGYEAVVNVLGRMGVGRRSDKALADAAVVTLMEAGVVKVSLIEGTAGSPPGE